MQISYNWLQQYIDLPWSATELAQRLTMAGIEVEQVIYRADALAGVVTGRIIKLEPHPNADKLQICTLDVGQSSPLTIVTGADNVFENAIVPVALDGAALPTGQEICHTDLRGVLSAGMLCSAEELAIEKKMVPSDMHDGIYILPADVAPGLDIRQVMGLDDYILELDLTPNRADCLSLLGLAYEISALSGQEIKLPSLVALESESPETDIAVEVVADDICPGYLGLVVDNVRIGKSPLWMQNALQAAGLRPINNLVDITNYVLLELGQPLHAFDLDAIEGQKILVRQAEPGEQITTLDGMERTLSSNNLVIADRQQAVAIAGVMGGLQAEVKEGTQRVFLESAYFDYKSIRRTSRELGLHTDASSRFDKGVDPGRVLMALQRAAYLISELECGQPHMVTVGSMQGISMQQKIRLRPQKVEQLLGVAIDASTMRTLLERLQLHVNDEVDPWIVTTPSRRLDLQEEVDLVEEIARLYGYENIPARSMQGPVMRGGLSARQAAVRSMRRQLVGLGLTEVVTLGFVNPQEIVRLVGPQHPWNRGLRLQNPLTLDRSMMRPSLLTGLLGVLTHNAARQQHDMAIFEMANVFRPQPGAGLQQPLEPLHLGIACMGGHSRGWQGDTVVYDFFYVKGVLETLFQKFDMNDVAWLATSKPFLHPGRAAIVQWQGEAIACMGELHPDILEHYGLKQRAVIAEVNLEVVLQQAGTISLFKPLPRYPAVERDLAIVVDKHVAAAQVEDIIWRAGGDLLIDLSLFDVYEGEQIDSGKKVLPTRCYGKAWSEH